MGWISGYQETLGDLGIEDEEARFPQGGSRGTTLLIDKYIERMHATLHAWFVNILEVSGMPGDAARAVGMLHVCAAALSGLCADQADLNSAPKQADDGRLWTPGAVDFFRIVNEQVAVVEEVSSADMLLRTGEAILQVMREFQVRARCCAPHVPAASFAACAGLGLTLWPALCAQEAQQRHLQRDLSDALLCAVINNNFRCYNESTEFAEHLDAVLAEPLKALPCPALTSLPASC